MICLMLFLAIAPAVMAGYSDSSYTGSNKVNGGYGYGYSGSYSGANGEGGGGGIPPYPQFDFNNFLQSYFDNLRKYHEQFATQIQQGAGFSGYGFPGGFPAAAGFGGQGQGGYGGSYSGNYGGGQEGAAASASIGPQGIHQTAGVFPEDPNYPNVETRFASSQDGGGGGGGFYSVSTASESGSSNVNGNPSSFHRASTTVNDNGKVTTYTVKKP